MSGACNQHAMLLDRHVSKELTAKLFANKKLLGKQAGDNICQFFSFLLPSLFFFSSQENERRRDLWNFRESPAAAREEKDKRGHHVALKRLLRLKKTPVQKKLSLTGSNVQENILLVLAADSGASDIVSTNIQRGRDHGLGSYNSARAVAGLPYAASMQSRPAEIGQEQWDALAKLYKNPDDIDLFSGGLAESHVPGE